MRIVADQHHSIGSLIEAHAMTRCHQSREIAERTTTGRNPTSPFRQIKSGRKPTTKLTFELTQAGRSSSASKLLLRPAQISSAAIEAVFGGGSRCARAPGWVG